MKKYVSETIKVCIITALVIVGVGSAYAWTGPSALPPNNNVSAPLNSSNILQEKQGVLGTRGFYSLGTAWFSTSTRPGWPPANLTVGVNGAVGAKLYCDDLGQNCYPINQLGIQGPKGDTGPAGTSTIPAHAVVAYNDSCPSGWSEFTAARGRYVVGLNSGGTLGKTVGTALSDGENRGVPPHVHSLRNNYHPGAQINTASGAQKYYSVTTAGSGSLVGDGNSNTGNVVGNPPPGTNAPYIQLRYCEKN